jgi:predicted PurR-regulated permease PerM
MISNMERPETDVPDTRSERIAARKPAAQAVGPNASQAMTLFVMIVATLYFGKEVLMPITLASLMAFVLSPVVNLLRRAHLGRVPSVLLGVTLGLGVVIAIGGVVGSQVAQFSTDIPKYAAGVERKVANVRQFTIGRIADLADKIGSQKGKAEAPAEASPSGSQPPSSAGAQAPVVAQRPGATPLELAECYLSPVLSPFATFGIVFIVAVFALLQKEDLRDRLIRLVGSDDLHRTTVAIDDGAQRLSRYFLTQLIINVTFGVVIGAGLLVIGLPNPVLWGILAALLRFVPYVGSFLAAILPMALAAAVEPGWSLLLWTAGLFVGIEGLTGQVVEPLVYGNSTGLSPFSVVVAAIFWSWLWGPVGLILSTPLTLCLVVIGRHATRLEFLDIMLGDRPPLTPVETLYQRILAGDADEAQDHAELVLKERSLGTYYDEVVIEAMRLATADVARDAIDEDQLERVDRTVKSLIRGLDTYKDEPPPRNSGIEPPLATPELPAEPNPRALAANTEEPRQKVTVQSNQVLCVAGRGPLDETAATMTVQLLGKHGIAARLVTYSEVSRDGIGTLETHDAAIVCITCIDIAGTPAHLRYLIQRLRQRLPRGAQIILGIRSAEDPALNNDALRAGIGADVIAGSLEEMVVKCAQLSTAVAKPAIALQ